MFGKERLACLTQDLIFAAPPCEIFIFVSDQNYVTSGIRSFDHIWNQKIYVGHMPSPGSFQNIGLQV